MPPPAVPAIETIVVPQPTRERSSSAQRRIASEPAKERSRTPAPKQTPASSSKDPESSAAATAKETGESIGKSKKTQQGDTAEKPLKIPSKVKTNELDAEIQTIILISGFDPADAKRMVEMREEMKKQHPSRWTN